MRPSGKTFLLLLSKLLNTWLLGNQRVRETVDAKLAWLTVRD